MSHLEAPNQVLVRYGEIGLKSPGVRRHLETLLHNHLTIMLNRNNVPFTEISRERGRFFIHTPAPEDAAKACTRVFGIVSVSPTWKVPAQMEAIVSSVTQLALNLLKKNQRFAIRARRLKTHPFTSQDIAAQAGSAIMQAMTSAGLPVTVNLDAPDVEIHVEARQQSAYIFTKVLPGPGGFPYGSQGTVIGLHSGGLDSPVAQWLLMKRGANVIPLFFDTDDPNAPRLSGRAQESANALAEWIPMKRYELLVIPFREVLSQLQRSKHPKLTCILCKRMMYRLSAMVAAQEEAKALVTGEMLGQVASQTLTNLTVLSSAVAIPILRPLVGFDKTDVMALARRIGTYAISSQDVGDCYAVPEHPAIGASLDDVHTAESELPLPELAQKAFTGLKRVQVVG
ncbi:MAG: tRNA uracil 4-sulfurtransferase ThiI [Candidatus Hermodarchaeota archaeon]|nr:tRNA uracil 4-sulfurtransferase ThiI [Candidatus Hermodarchaeota archaeon]